MTCTFTHLRCLLADSLIYNICRKKLLIQLLDLYLIVLDVGLILLFHLGNCVLLAFNHIHLLSDVPLQYLLGLSLNANVPLQ